MKLILNPIKPIFNIRFRVLVGIRIRGLLFEGIGDDAHDWAEKEKEKEMIKEELCVDRIAPIHLVLDCFFLFFHLKVRQKVFCVLDDTFFPKNLG